MELFEVFPFFQLTPVDHNSQILLQEQLLTVCPLRYWCRSCLRRQAGGKAGKAGKGGNNPRLDFPLAQTLLMTRLGYVPRGGTLGMQEGVCRDRGRHSGREESGQLCAQLEGELKGGAELFSPLASFPFSSHRILWSCRPGPAQLPCFFPVMLLVPVWRDPGQPRGA